MRDKHIKKRLLTVILMLAVFFAYQPMAAFAENAEITYLDENGTEVKTTEYSTLHNTSVLLNDGIYFVNEDLEIGHNQQDLSQAVVELKGDTTFIIADDKTLTIPAGLNTIGLTLKIYSQTKGTGQLVIKDDSDLNEGATVINKDPSGTPGNIVVNGGKVTITGGTSSDGAGCVAFSGGKLTVNKGTVNITGGAGSNGENGTDGASGEDGEPGGNGGNGGTGVKGALEINGGKTTITGGTGGNGGTGGKSSREGDPVGFKGGISGAGGNGGNGGDAFSTDKKIEVKGGTLNIIGGNGGNGGKGGQAPYGGISGDGGKAGKGGAGFLSTNLSDTNLIVDNGASVKIKGGNGSNGGSVGDEWGGYNVSTIGSPQPGGNGSAAFIGEKIEVNGGRLELTGGNGGDGTTAKGTIKDGGKGGEGFSGKEIIIDRGTVIIDAGSSAYNKNGSPAFSGEKFNATNATSISVGGGTGGRGKDGGDAFSGAEVVIEKCDYVNIQGGKGGSKGTGGCGVNGGTFKIKDVSGVQTGAVIIGGAGNGDTDGNGGDAFKNTTVTIENSSLTVYGGDGASGANYDGDDTSGTIGGKGGNGGNGATGVSMNITNSTVKFSGGKGGKGGNGRGPIHIRDLQYDWNSYNGGDAGNGGSALEGSTLTLKGSTVTFNAGDGGNGGKGAKFVQESKPKGGNGGNGGSALEGSTLALEDSTASIISGNAGEGGAGGVESTPTDPAVGEDGSDGTDGNAVTAATTLPDMDGKIIRIKVSSHGSDEFDTWDKETDLDTYRAITVIAHNTHIFKYSASDAKITVTCSVEDCDEINDTLTLINPTDLTYDGEAKEATISDAETKAWTDGGYAAPSAITYYLSNGTTKTTAQNSGAASEGAAPVNAGSYVAKMSVTDGDSNTCTASTSFTIAKAGQVKAAVVMDDYTYGETPSTPGLDKTLTGNPNVKYYYSTTNSASGGTEWTGITATSLAVGTYYMYAVIGATDNYESLTTGTTEFKVEKTKQGDLEVTMSGYTYGETPSKPALSGEPLESATVTYYYNTSKTTSGGKAWKNVEGTTLDAGTYYMYAVIGETDTYQSQTTKATEFKVAKAKQSNASVVMDGYTYGQILSKPTLNGTLLGDPTITYYYNTNNSNSGGKVWKGIKNKTLKPGTYYMYAVATSKNYEDLITDTTEFKVEEGEGTDEECFLLRLIKAALTTNLVPRAIDKLVVQPAQKAITSIATVGQTVIRLISRLTQQLVR